MWENGKQRNQVIGTIWLSFQTLSKSMEKLILVWRWKRLQELVYLNTWSPEVVVKIKLWIYFGKCGFKLIRWHKKIALFKLNEQIINFYLVGGTITNVTSGSQLHTIISLRWLSQSRRAASATKIKPFWIMFYMETLEL